jgi:ferrous iron transport protein B
MAHCEEEKMPRPAPASATLTRLVAIAGNPNTGKSSIFNILCGAKQRVGNYPGVTVEKKFGRALLPSGLVDVVDLPGIYSLKAISPDEEVSSDFIMGRLSDHRRPDLILFVLDATNIKRNLYLYSQIAELEMPITVVLTMTDLLEREGISIDVEALKRELGVPVLPFSGKSKESIDDLRNEMSRLLDHPVRSRAITLFPERLEKISASLRSELTRHIEISLFEARNLLYFKKDPLIHFFVGNGEALGAIERAQAEARDHGFIAPSLLSVERYRSIDRIVGSVEVRHVLDRVTVSERLDRIFTHRLFGLAIFGALMYGVFQSIYTWASPVMGVIEGVFELFGARISLLLAGHPILESLIVDGAIGGVGSVVVFLPQIVFLFLFIAVLEDSGYLARAAFLMDRLLSWTGLNGRAFIPMLSGFACCVPAVLSTRVMPDAKSRFTTIMILPLMSCSARLPLYLLFIGAFIEPRYGAGWAAFSLFAMHAIGPLLALPVAYIFNRSILQTTSSPFILEMPPYHMPNLFSVVMRVYEAASSFLRRAGTVIFAMSLLIWALSYFPRPDHIEREIRTAYAEEAVAPSGGTESDQLSRKISAAYLENSYLGRAGKMIEPIFRPLGYDWKISVGILGAFPAREVLISTLGILYQAGDRVDENSPGLKERMAIEKRPDGTPVFTPLVAVSLMVFFALCSQCISTLATVQRELNSALWALLQFSYMTLFAYLFAFLVYNVGRLIGLE